MIHHAPGPFKEVNGAADRIFQQLSDRPGGGNSVAVSLGTDLEEVLTALRFSESHRKRIRGTNLLERLFGEGQRRVKVMPRFMSEKSGLGFVFAVLADASAAWRGVKITWCRPATVGGTAGILRRRNLSGCLNAKQASLPDAPAWGNIVAFKAERRIISTH